MKTIKNFDQFNEHYNPLKTKLKDKMSYDDWCKRYSNDVLDTYWLNSDSDNIPDGYTKEDALKNAYKEYLMEVE